MAKLLHNQIFERHHLTFSKLRKENPGEVRHDRTDQFVHSGNFANLLTEFDERKPTYSMWYNYRKVRHKYRCPIEFRRIRRDKISITELDLCDFISRVILQLSRE